jgi:hypothetical protein
MPSADSRRTVKMDRSLFSHDSVTCGGSPEVSSTAFRAPPPDLPPVRLVEPGFAVICQLAQHRRPHHPVLVHRLAPLLHASFRPRLATTPLRFASPSPPPDWAGDFHPPSCRTCSAHIEKAQPVGHAFISFWTVYIQKIKLEGVNRQLWDIYFLNGINGIGGKWRFGGLTRFGIIVTCGHHDGARGGIIRF